MLDLSPVDVEDLLKRLDLGENARLTSGGTEIHFKCFGPEHSDGGSAYINIETTAWICHGCKRRGNAIHLVMEVQQIARATAERFLRDTYGIEFSEPVGGSMVAETEARFREVIVPPPPTPPPASWLVGARLDWWTDRPEPFQQYMIGRGFDPVVLADWDIGYDYLSNRVTIPVFDIDGTLVGVKGRDWTDQDERKYMILGDRQYPRYGFQPYEASEVVFGLHRNRSWRSVVVLEGELNALALSQLGVPRPVAAGMSYFSERHAQLIAREADEAVVYYDAGQAGHDGVWGRIDSAGVHRPGVAQMLETYMPVRVVEPLLEDPAKLLELGRGREALALIEQAKSTLVIAPLFV